MMEDVKTSVDEQLSQIDARLAAQAVSSTEEILPAQVLSSEGVQDASLQAEHSRHATNKLEDPILAVEPHLESDEADLAMPLPTPDQEGDHAAPQFSQESPEGSELTELEMVAVEQVPDALTQVLSGFSDSWVTEMSQRVGDLKEHIAVVHHKLDQFSPR
ncbi:MAG: hypothetical protein RL307_1375 [Pseudomonadota bacterium]|jgi:flagellum-specific peptidoglycan hydrolase FlgJ